MMNILSKPKKYFLNTAVIPALIVFKIWTTSTANPSSFFIISGIMFFYCLFIIFIAYRWDKPGYFDLVISGYFFFIYISMYLSTVFTAIQLKKYGVTLIYSCLFLAAFFPPLVKMDPFTMHYAKKTAPEEFWEEPLFLKINHIMTFTWAAMFGICAAISLYPSVITRAVIPISIIAGFGLPFNLRFPYYYLNRLGISLPEPKKLEPNPD
jgi:hypothetical protein